MSFVDSYIKVRERSLNWILGSKSNSSLNLVSKSTQTQQASNDLAGEIKSSLNQFKAAAIDEEGRFVDYEQLSQIPAFKQYAELISRL
jgi:hypothetical protein